MNLQWIDQQLRERGMNRRMLADAIPGMTQTKMSLTMSGNRKLSADEAACIYRLFGYRMPDDPPRTEAERLSDLLAKIGDHQIPAVALYLEALAGVEPAQSQAAD